MNAAPQARAKWHDAYDTQMALWRWYRTEEGVRWLAYSFNEAARALQAGTREMLLDLYTAERGRLIDLDPIFVSTEMCEVVDAAKESFEPEPLMETDLLTTHGFLYFEKPFDVLDRFEEPTTIHAVAWSRIIAAGDEQRAQALQGMVDAAAGSGVTLDAIEEKAIEDGARAAGIALTIYATSPESAPPPVIPYHVTPWYFGMTFDGNEVDENDEPTGAAWWWRVVQTTFRLMQQHIAVKHLQRPDRSSRREAKRLRFPDEAEVVVVRLRREAGERSEPSGEAANYSHRFIVSGHWRNQWYPSISAHRQIWISPYVKGPEGLPLIVRPRRVFQWER